MRRSTGPATGTGNNKRCYCFHPLSSLSFVTQDWILNIIEDGGKSYVFVFSDLGLSLRHHQEGPGLVPLSTNRIML